MKNLIIAFTVIIGLFLLGCSQVHDNQVWEITNNSSTDIYVEFEHIGYEESVAETITPGETKSIFYKDRLFTNENLESPMQFATVEISNNEGALVKDENINENLTITSKKIRKLGDVRSYTYSFILGNSDF